MPLDNPAAVGGGGGGGGGCGGGQRGTQGRRRRVTPLACFVTLALLMMLKSVAGIVVQQVRFISSKTGRLDYAVAGESMELTCHYLMKDDDEDIKQVDWKKDGLPFAKWHKNRLGIDVHDYAFKGRFDQSSTYSHLIIHNATIDMAGKYTCSIRTDLGWGSEDVALELVVVARPACRLDDWRLASERAQCRETLQLDCRHMFPRPAQSCGLWNSRTETFIRSVPIHISEEPPTPASLKQTYRVRYDEKFRLAGPDGRPDPIHGDLLQFAGHVVFKCDIFIPGTSWRLGLSRKLFDFADGCEQDPLEAVRKLRAAYNQHVLQRVQSKQQRHGPARGQKRPPGQLIHMDDSANFTVELLLPSEVRRLARLNKLAEQPEAAPDSGANATNDLNCWRKPRLGSIVRLACPSQAAGRPLKLMGANMLECRPAGWTLIRGSANSMNNEILDTRVHKVAFNRRRKPEAAVDTWPLPTRPFKELEASDKQPPVGATDSAQATLEPADLTGGRGSSTTEREDTTIPSTTVGAPPGEDDPDEDADLVDKSQPPDGARRQQLRSVESAADHLADLLPTCVALSTKRRNFHAKAPNGQLLESNAIVQGSTDERHFRTSGGDEPAADDGWPAWRWMVSGAGPRAAPADCVAALGLVIMATAMMLLQRAQRVCVARPASPLTSRQTSQH